MTALTLCAAILLASNSGEFELYKHQARTACATAETIIHESNKAGFDPAVLAALIFAESRFNKNAVSSAGACGLTQVIGSYVARTCDELKRPMTSILAGIEMLERWRSYLQRTKPDYTMRDLIACYNVGKLCSKSPSARAHAGLVLRAAERYRSLVTLLHSERDPSITH